MNPINFVNPTAAKFGSLNLGVYPDYECFGHPFADYRVNIELNDKPDDTVLMNGRKLGTSSIAKELTVLLREKGEQLAPKVVRDKVREFFENPSLLDDSTADPRDMMGLLGFGVKQLFEAEKLAIANVVKTLGDGGGMVERMHNSTATFLSIGDKCEIKS